MTATVEILQKQIRSYEILVKSMEEELSHYRKKDYRLSEKKLSSLEKYLDSEKKMNEELTNECEIKSRCIDILISYLKEIAHPSGHTDRYGADFAVGLARESLQVVKQILKDMHDKLG